MIDSHSFGSIVIDGKNYTKDVIIYPDGYVQGSWWRKDGHKLCSKDICTLIDSTPEVIIAGTGAYGIMKPEPELVELLDNKGIELRAFASGRAVAEYNQLCGKKEVGACIHLTC